MPSSPLTAQYGEPGPGVGLRERAPLVVPAHREQAVVVGSAVLGEVADDAVGGVAQLPERRPTARSAIAPTQNGAAAAKR